MNSKKWSSFFGPPCTISRNLTKFWQKISWHSFFRHGVEIRRRANINSMEYIVMQRQLRWLGHVIRMPANRLSRHVLYGELLQGSRSQGGQKKWFSDHIKATLKKCHIPPDELKALSEDRSVCRDTCKASQDSFHDWVEPGCRRLP